MTVEAKKELKKLINFMSITEVNLELVKVLFLYFDGNTFGVQHRDPYLASNL